MLTTNEGYNAIHFLVPSCNSPLPGDGKLWTVKGRRTRLVCNGQRLNWNSIVLSFDRHSRNNNMLYEDLCILKKGRGIVACFCKGYQKVNKFLNAQCIVKVSRNHLIVLLISTSTINSVCTWGSNWSSPFPRSTASFAIKLNTRCAASAPSASAAGELPNCPRDGSAATAAPCDAAANAEAIHAMSRGLNHPAPRRSTYFHDELKRRLWFHFSDCVDVDRFPRKIKSSDAWDAKIDMLCWCSSS